MEEKQPKQYDGNRIIGKLSKQVAELSKTIAILEIDNEDLQNVVDKQKAVIDAYEEKENRG